MLNRIEQRAGTLSRAEKRVADWVVAHPRQAALSASPCPARASTGVPEGAGARSTAGVPRSVRDNSATERARAVPRARALVIARMGPSYVVRAAAHTATHVDAAYEVGVILAEAGQGGEAVTYYQRAIESAPDDPELLSTQIAAAARRSPNRRRSYRSVARKRASRYLSRSASRFAVSGSKGSSCSTSDSCA